MTRIKIDIGNGGTRRENSPDDRRNRTDESEPRDTDGSENEQSEERTDRHP